MNDEVSIELGAIQSRNDWYGYMAKNDKSKGMHFLVKDVDDAPIPHAADTLLIQDHGNAPFHTMTHEPGNLQLMSHQIFDRDVPGRLH